MIMFVTYNPHGYRRQLNYVGIQLACLLNPRFVFASQKHVTYYS